MCVAPNLKRAVPIGNSKDLSLKKETGPDWNSLSWHIKKDVEWYPKFVFQKIDRKEYAAGS